MLKLLTSLTALASVALAGRRHASLNKFQSVGADTVIMPPLADNSTYGNTEQIHTTHVHLNLTADFDAKTLSGWAYHKMEVLETTSIVQFDIWDLTISQVVDINTHASLDYTILQPNPLIGSVLQIQLGRDVNLNDIVEIGIEYTTSPTGQAFSWLNPEQTSGGQLPYMFTQCEDINCRSVAPLQDTPSNRITYSASIYAVSDLVVKMSANETGVDNYGTLSVSHFECTIPIPCYLIAIAIGDLEYKSLGSRVGVITEPSQMDVVAAELADMGDLLDAVEEYMGPYIWGNYTIIVLPPSFPMGGMENPLLTFASPTIIVGDKSQVYVATHEMAHSWTGNEVTCENWENFWLNEGFTVFIERHVSGEIHGEDFSKVSALLGNTSMYQDMEGFGLTNTYSSLHPVLRGDNPDSSFSEVPYEKGFQLLYYLQSLIGMAEMKSFLNFYMSEHKLTSITTVQLRATWEFYVENMIPDLSGEEVNQILAAVDWSAWLYTPGLPPVDLDFTTAASNESAALALEYIALGGDSSPANFQDYYGWYSNLKVVFHDTLQNNYDQVTIAILTKIDQDLSCTTDTDPEVKQRWFPTGLGLQYQPVYDPAHTWISSMGRSKYLCPVYASLEDSGQHDLGVTWYEENADFYHPVAATSVREILGIESSSQHFLKEAKLQALAENLEDTIADYANLLQ